MPSNPAVPLFQTTLVLCLQQSELWSVGQENTWGTFLWKCHLWGQHVVEEKWPRAESKGRAVGGVLAGAAHCSHCMAGNTRNDPTREDMCPALTQPCVPSCPQGCTPPQDSNMNLSSACTHDLRQGKAAVGFLNERDDKDGDICP